MGTTAREPVQQSQEDDEPDKRARSNWEPKLLLLLLQRCRICAGSARPAVGTDEQDEQQDDGPPTRIFADDPASASLRGNIHKYLHIAVSSEDKLPKVVCASCVNKLEDIHAFATMALKSQERLKQELLRTTGDSVVAIDSSDSSDSTTNKLEDRGLLHSILTKGSLDTSNDGESVAGRQRTPSTEEMEVKVDPMLFLQCALDQPSSADYSDYSDDSVREVNSYSGPLPESTSLADGQDKSAIGKVRSRCRDSNDNESPLAKRMASDDYEQDYDFEEEELDEEDEEEEEEEELVAETGRRSSSSHACKLCGRSFGSQLGLQNHLWSHLPTTARSDSAAAKDTGGTTSGACLEGNGLLAAASYICPICGKRISTKGNLKVHLETHRPKGKYGCDICGRIFKTQSNLFRHKEYHSSVQFPCSVCGRVYPTNSTLRAHSITHSDLRPHACPLCDKTFKRNQDLKFHINQHTGARPYQCPYCPKAFASSGNCFSHRKRMHPKEVHRDRQRAADLMR